MKVTKPQGHSVTCGCFLPHHLSQKQSLRRAFISGLTFMAFPLDYREREDREAAERFEHIISDCPRLGTRRVR